MNNVSGNGEIVVEKLGRPAVIRQDSADRCSADDDRIRSIIGKPLPRRRLIAQIELAPADGQQFAAFACKTPRQRRADHAAMAGNPYALAFELKHCRWLLFRSRTVRTSALAAHWYVPYSTPYSGFFV